MTAVNRTIAANAGDATYIAPVFRWAVLLISWFAVTLTFIDRLAWATVAIEAGRSLSIPVAALGMFVTAFYIGYVASNVVGGLSSDRFGPERVILFSLVPLGIATFCFGFATNVPFGVVLQMLMGLAAGANYSASVKLLVLWFGPKERGRALGLFTSANSFGVVVANALVPTITATFGWQWAYHTLGFVTSAYGIVAYLLLRGRSAPGAPTPSARLEPLVVFRDRNLTLLALAGFCAMWGTWGVAFWANALMIKQFGMTPVETGTLLVFFGVTGMLSKPTMGYLLDLVGPNQKKPLLIVAFVGFAVALAWYSMLTGVSQFRFATPFLGLWAFIYTPVLVGFVSDVAGPQRTGTAVGITNATWQLGSVIVPIAVGLVFSATGSFQFAFLTLAVGPALAALLISLMDYKSPS